MIRFFYRKRRLIAFFLLVTELLHILPMQYSYALTSGPSQPESQGFQAAGTTDMVDLFSGDFKYNIPLFELPGPNGGYPFSLSYQSGIGMDQEASWVGLGWSLTPGAINRQMRGLPDEFKGDAVHTKMSMKTNVTVGVGVGTGLEVFGSDSFWSLNVGFGINLNNYKGFGYSIDASIGYHKAAQSEGTAGVGLDVSLNSQEGVNVNPSLSLGQGIISINGGYNSRNGMETISINQTVAQMVTDEGEVYGGTSISSPISLSHPGYTPQVSLPMTSGSVSASIKVGGSFWGLFASPYIHGFYNEQKLKNDKRRVPARAFGYMNYQERDDATAIMDFNREKDGIITKQSPNLPIPFATYDIYSVSGQGISAMYRPMRNDYGILHDPETVSESVAGSIGVDLAVAFAHVGYNGRLNYSRSVSGKWTSDNDMSSHIPFQHKTSNSDYEPWYFKVHGEPASELKENIDRLGDLKPVRIGLEGNDSNPKATRALEKGFLTQVGDAPSPTTFNRERKSRNQSIQPITNEELIADNGDVILPAFKIIYKDNLGNNTSFVRDTFPQHHIAGFTAVNAEGLRYVYGIPAYNLHQEEVVFSAKKEAAFATKVNVGNAGSGDPKYKHDQINTDEFLKRVEIPPYAHSYLLTSILGPDYVDQTGDGVTPDDKGYWVKFTYRKSTSNKSAYRWRDPFSKAHFQEGYQSDARDDKGQFVYGEKEMWYLEQAETKSHIAVFSLMTREDGYGVAEKLQDSNRRGKAILGLREIKLYTRAAGPDAPLKVVRFDYDYSLCQGIYNSVTGKGKLTLKKVWFEYGKSKRGALNPYEFFYNEDNPDENPRYDQHAYDRWGNYKQHPEGDSLANIHFPYVAQQPDKKEMLDLHASAWNLKRIRMPSGGEVTVDYEIDDYAYVQHLPAMQMMEIVNPYSAPEQSESGTEFMLTNEAKVRFKLERVLGDTLSAEQQKAEVQKYLDLDRNQIFFKARINLKTSGLNLYEFIHGYADIDTQGEMKLEKDANGNLAYGSFYLKQEDNDRHPFSVRAWQHLRTNQPDLASNMGNNIKQTSNTGERVNQIRSLGTGNIITHVRQMFTGFNAFCYRNGWGREVMLGKAWIRLNSPDRIKYGGGVRVRQITLKDSWSETKEGVYGQIYEYTKEENNRIISSGVAAYEPLTGGEEIPLRYARKFVKSIPLRSPNNLFFEYPINESYFPGANVGYSKVTVTSLAGAYLAGKPVKHIKLADGKVVFPKGNGVSYGTSGTTIHEFYTAKDYPVITEETDKEDKSYNLAVPIPFLGSLSISKLTSSQGYSIVTNDMHGKPKSIENYRQDRFGVPEPKPISWVKYNYSDTTSVYQKQQIKVLNNVFVDNGDGTLSLHNKNQSGNGVLYTLGQENEFFTDMREYEDQSWGGGAAVNGDFIFFFLFGGTYVPTVWPNVSKTTTQLRTAVTNKIIFKAGMLKSTEAYDGGSHVVTQNMKWSKLTGMPILTKVNNNFNAPVFNYSIPAYTKYQGMGAAFNNIGLAFNVSDVDNLPYHDNYYQFTSPSGNKLFPGDEIILYNNDHKAVAKVTYAGEEHGDRLFYSDVTLSDRQYSALIVRSGYRNQLTVSAGTITALADPTIPSATKTYTKTITIPKEN